MPTDFEFDVFLSHSSEDKPAIEVIALRLRDEFGLNPFLDKWNLPPGETWPNALERALDQSATTAVFLGPGETGPWQDQEMQRALVKAVKTHEEYRIIPVLLPGSDSSQVPAFLGLRTWVDFRAGVDDEEAFNRLVGGIKGEAVETGGFKLPDEPAPYRGLSRFEKDQTGFFFGRSTDIDRLVEKLGRGRFLAVVGASGSGKSSLVRAGLLPRIEQDAVPGSREWRIILLMPGSEPLRALANQMALKLPANERPKAANELVNVLGEGERGLRNTLTSWYAESPAPLLLIFDQFEEIFTQAIRDIGSGTDQREQTSKLIASIADLVHNGSDMRVLITLRTDFLDRCLEFPVLRELLQDNQLLLGELGDEALREAVVLPAQKVGAFFETGLVNLILRDVTGERGSLPLLQHALLELWKARRGPWLTQQSYEESGGVTGALKRFAQRIYDSFAPDEQQIARNIFVRITSLGEGVTDTRRRVPRADLYPAGAAPEAVDGVIDTLSGKDARLIVAGEEGVEVTHESLLQEWDTLRGWLDEDRDAQRLRQRIGEAANQWRESGHQESDLYAGGRLELAEQWENDHPGTLNRLEQAFLDASREKREAGKRRRRNRVLGLAVVAATATVLALVAVVFWLEAREQTRIAKDQTELANDKAQEAKRERDKATKAREKAEANERRANNRLGKYFLSEAKSLQATAPDLSLLLAVEALRVSDLPAVQHSFREILTNAQHRGLPLIGHENDVTALAFDPRKTAGHLLASADGDGTVLLWNLGTPDAEPLALRSHIGAVLSMAFDPQGIEAGRLVTAGADGIVRVWDLNAPEAQPILLHGHESKVYSATFEPQGTGTGRLVSGGEDGILRIWDLNAPEAQPIRLLGHEGKIYSATFEPQGAGTGRLASAGEDGIVRIWDLDTPETEPIRLHGHEGEVYSVAFEPQGIGTGRLASAGEDGIVRIWDIKALEAQPIRLLGHEGKVHSVTFDPQGTGTGLLASAGEDGIARIWDLKDPEAKPQVLGDKGLGIHLVAYDPRGTGAGRLAGAGTDGNLRQWDLNALGAEPVIMDVGTVERFPGASFNWPGAKTWRLAVGPKDGGVQIWNLKAPLTSPRNLPASGDHLFDLAFDPSGPGAGRLVARVAFGNFLWVWDLDAPEVEPPKKVRFEGVITSMGFDPSGPGALRLLVAGRSVSDVDARQTVPLLQIENTGADTNLGQAGISIGFDPRGTGAGRVAVATKGGAVRVWDLDAPATGPQVIVDSDRFVWSVAFDPQENPAWRLAGAGTDNVVRVWDLGAPGAKPRELDGHKGRIWTMAFEPKREGAGLLAGAGTAGRVWVWDLSTPEADPIVLSGHEGAIVSLAFEPGGTGPTRLASVAIDGTARIWTLDNDLLARKACAISGRNLSQAEWTRYFGDDDLHLTCPDRPIHPDYLKHGKKLALDGKIEEAIAAFTTELERFRSQSFDVSRLARRYAAKKEIAEANSWYFGLYYNPSSEEIYRFLDSEYTRRMKEHAESKWARAMELDPSLRILPADRWARSVSAGLVAAGDAVAGKGDAAAALAAYRRAMEIFPGRRFDAGARAAPHLVKKGDSLATFAKVEAAVAIYEKAIELDPSQSLEPVSRARQLAAEWIRRQTRNLAKAGDIDQALEDYRRARAWNADLPEDPGIENALCWNGSLWNRGADVLIHCDRAVRDDLENGGYRDSRGLARALAGVLQGAAEDFRAFLRWGPDNKRSEEHLAKRRQWLDALESGRNPFDDPAALKRLREDEL